MKVGDSREINRAANNQWANPVSQRLLLFVVLGENGKNEAQPKSMHVGAGKESDMDKGIVEV